MIFSDPQILNVLSINLKSKVGSPVVLQWDYSCNRLSQMPMTVPMNLRQWLHYVTGEAYLYVEHLQGVSGCIGLADQVFLWLTDLLLPAHIWWPFLCVRHQLQPRHGGDDHIQGGFRQDLRQISTAETRECISPAIARALTFTNNTQHDKCKYYHLDSQNKSVESI